MTNLHYIADEQLGGVEREYAEVECKADVGDYVVVKEDGFNLGYYGVGDVFSVRESVEKGVTGCNEKTGMFFLINDEYATLDPTGNVRIDGTVYRMVERKAAVGEKVLITEIDHCEVSEIRDVIELDSDYFGVIYLDKPIDDCDYIDMATDKYHVLEPNEIFTCTYDPSKVIIASNPPAESLELTEADVRDNPRQVIDLIANLALRVTTLEKGADRLSKLESKVARLGTANQQAYDIVARNVETWAQEIEGIKAEKQTSFGTFDFSQLGGKTLKIVTGVDMADGVTCTTVIGYDESDGKYYVLDTKLEGRALTADERREL